MTDKFHCIACHQELSCTTITTKNSICIRCKANNIKWKQLTCSNNNNIWNKFTQWSSFFPLALFTIILSPILSYLIYYFLTRFLKFPNVSLFTSLLALFMLAASVVPCRVITKRWVVFFEQYRKQKYHPQIKIKENSSINNSLIFSILWVSLLTLTGLVLAPILMPVLSQQVADISGVSEMILPKEIISDLHKSLELTIQDPSPSLHPTTIEHLKNLYLGLGNYLSQFPEQEDDIELLVFLIQDLKFTNEQLQTLPPELQNQISNIITELEVPLNINSPMPVQETKEMRQTLVFFWVFSIFSIGSFSIFLSWKSVEEFINSTDFIFSSENEKPIYNNVERLKKVVEWDLINMAILQKHQYKPENISEIIPDPNWNNYDGVDFVIRYKQSTNEFIHLFICTNCFGTITGGVHPFPNALEDIPHKIQVETYRQLNKYFNKEELECLCFELKDIEWENLGGSKRQSKCKELVSQSITHGQFYELIELIKEKRPSIIK